MSNDYLIYLQEIPDASWVIELISEQFDDAINMMTTNSIVYGGAVRDCLSGKKLLGDLDIVVIPTEHHILVDRFIKSPKWVLIDKFQKELSNSYENFGISRIISFKTLGNKIVQIIKLPAIKDTSFQAVINFVKRVDIVCCGVILNSNGKVFEIIPNAYKDCKNNILHLNNSYNIDSLERFQSRIKKLVERGWHNNININQVIKSVKRSNKQRLKQKNSNQVYNLSLPQKKINYMAKIIETEKLPISPTHIKIFNYAKTIATTINGNGYQIFIPNESLGDFEYKRNQLFSLLEHLAEKHSIDLGIQIKTDGIRLITCNEPVSNFVYKKLFS